MSALSTTGHNDGITLHCLQSIAQLIPLSSAVFYRVNAYLKPEAYVLHNISNSTHQQYLEHFQPLDPLSPSRFGQQVITVATMTPGICARHRHYYHEFMLPNHVCDMIEIFIRRGHRIIAGISLMRDIPFSSEERLRAQAVQPLLGLAIHDSLQEDNDLASILTAKEREIVGMVCEGASNKLIARQLNISLSTVKTHLRNIFAKTEVINRTELVSRTRMSSV
ncbi:LuxR family transcriptional regulator [Salmonella enterica]|nr:LuxR family transcriptional regulator [Salmonella enterica subsp. enterica serovar Adelaide]EDP9478676.1 LuxR family transcriptional regulator [Salmonella enterica subsp. enterica serovar Havana]EDZ9224838.1 LuxR family transcriptional regulator [Salmonella enterica]EDO1588983.1 LuxR family transcriptional regulator [Salmonella enterica subsp. enterica serovar Adelaide]EIL0034664.1 LuxR family transcriptional regulator [Salmonella enterica]